MPDILLHTTCSRETEKGGERNGIRIIGTIELVLILELIEGRHRSTESRSGVERRFLGAGGSGAEAYLRGPEKT